MNITPLSFTGLVPLKKYNGPLLQLTKSEKTKIAALQDNISRLEIDLYRINKFYEGKHLTTQQSSSYLNKINTISVKIDDLKQLIRDIKTNRLNIQKKEI